MPDFRAPGPANVPAALSRIKQIVGVEEKLKIFDVQSFDWPPIPSIEDDKEGKARDLVTNLKVLLEFDFNVVANRGQEGDPACGGGGNDDDDYQGRTGGGGGVEGAAMVRSRSHGAWCRKKQNKGPSQTKILGTP